MTSRTVSTRPLPATSSNVLNPRAVSARPRYTAAQRRREGAVGPALQAERDAVVSFHSQRSGPTPPTSATGAATPGATLTQPAPPRRPPTSSSGCTTRSTPPTPAGRACRLTHNARQVIYFANLAGRWDRHVGRSNQFQNPRGSSMWRMTWQAISAMPYERGSSERRLPLRLWRHVPLQLRLHQQLGVPVLPRRALQRHHVPPRQVW